MTVTLDAAAGWLAVGLADRLLPPIMSAEPLPWQHSRKKRALESDNRRSARRSQAWDRDG